MKKFLLSTVVVVVFIAYSLVLRHQKATPMLTVTKSVPSKTASNPGATTPITRTVAYKDGTYDGSIADAFYGNVEVAVTVQSSKITGVKFLQYPHDSPNSDEINSSAIPLLQQEVIHAQSAHVDIVSGATQTSQAFLQSLSNALQQAQQA